MPNPPKKVAQMGQAGHPGQLAQMGHSGQAGHPGQTGYVFVRPHGKTQIKKL